MLTDGAVEDTEKVVQLIRQNRANSTVHTFGIGSGVSTELVKNCAAAGKGHYTFIDKPEEIEHKVMEAIQKDFLEYLIVKEARLLDENN